MSNTVKKDEVMQTAYKRLYEELGKEPINTTSVSVLTDVIRALSTAPDT